MTQRGKLFRRCSQRRRLQLLRIFIEEKNLKARTTGSTFRSEKTMITMACDRFISVVQDRFSVTARQFQRGSLSLPTDLSTVSAKIRYFGWRRLPVLDVVILPPAGTPRAALGQSPSGCIPRRFLPDCLRGQALRAVPLSYPLADRLSVLHQHQGCRLRPTSSPVRTRCAPLRCGLRCRP